MARPTVVRMLGLGKKIKAHRENANMTQRQMAKLLGIPYSTYSNYENDNRTPDTDTLQKICDILNISMQDLVGRFLGGADGNSDEKISDLIYRPITPLSQENLAIMAREQSMIGAFRKLNLAGQQEAVKRVEELTEIPRYRAETAPQSSPAPPEGKDTTPAEPPPESTENGE